MRLKCVFPLAVFAALLLGQAACQMDTVDDPDFDYMMDGSAGSGSASGSGTDPPPGPEFSNVNFTENCTLPDLDDIPAKPRLPATEQEAENQALCHVFCLENQVSGRLTGDDRDAFPGGDLADFIPNSHLYLDDEGSLNCNRFGGAFAEYQTCRVRCEMELNGVIVDDCVSECRSECENLPNDPCGRDCGRRTCEAGCDEADDIMGSGNYPQDANPVVAPVLEKVILEYYTLDIDASLNGISAGNLDLITSSILIRVHDLSSSLEDDFSYYILDDRPLFNLAPFVCRNINVSIAVASARFSGMSAFSPAAFMEVTPSDLELPDQLTGFEFTVEEDDRLEFFDHHVIHLQWEQPERIELVESYTIELKATFGIGSGGVGGISGVELCGTRTISGVPANATSYTVRAEAVGGVPVSECFYRTTILVSPTLSDFVPSISPDGLFSATIITPQYQPRLTANNIDFTCSVQLNRNTTLYDVQFNWNIHYPDPLLFALDYIQVTPLEITEAGDINPDGVDRSIDRVVIPNTANISQNYEQLITVSPLTEPGHFYRFLSNYAFENNLLRQTTAIIQECEETDVGPAPPDQVPIENIVILDSDFSETFFNQRRTVFGDIDFTWMPPEFQGFGLGGIVQYDVYIGRRILGPNAQLPSGVFEVNVTSASHSFSERTDDQDFNINLQFRARTLHVPGKWSEPFPINVTVFNPPLPDVMTDQNFNVTEQSYSILDDGTSVTVSLTIDWEPPQLSYGNITSFDVAVGVVELGPQDEPSSQQSFNFLVEETETTGQLTVVLQTPNSVVDSFNSFPIFVQMRAVSEFGVSGKWNESEIITLEVVLPPENITVEVQRLVVGSADNGTVSIDLGVDIFWSPPSEFPASGIEGYMAFLGEDFVEEPFGSVPSSARSATYEPGSVTTGRISGVFVVEDSENFTFYVQMRTESSFGVSGEWSEPISVTVTRPTTSQLPLILGTSITFGLLLLVLLLVLVGFCLFFPIRSYRIKKGYDTVRDPKGPGLDAYAATYIPAGYFEGKELLLDDWEVAANDVIVEDKLGEGAFGEVYKGVMRGPLRNPKISAVLKNTIGLSVAIKLLKTTASNKEKAEFLSEIELMKKIAEGYNAHIVNMIGCITLQEPLCLITEFVPHGDLITYLKAMRKKATTDRRRQRFLQQHYEAYQEMKRLQRQQIQQLDIERGYTFQPAVTRPIEPEEEDSTPEDRPHTPPEDKSLYVDNLQSPVKSPDNEEQVLGENDTTSLDDDEAAAITSPAPYLEAKNQYSHLDPLNPVDLQKFAAELPPDLLDEADFDEYTEVGQLEAGDLMQFAYQIATGMEYLASLNIVHRDLACRNILVGDDKKLKITDFGLSREVEEVYVKQTKGRLPLKWMALESIEERVFTTSSDVWAYGIALWEISTVGGFPYPTIPNTDLLMMLKQGYRLEKPDNCAPQIYDIMLECWQEDTMERPTFSQLRSKFGDLISAATDDPYMQLEVDEMKPYYSVEAEEESKQFQNRERANTKGNDDIKKLKEKKQLSLKPSNPYVENPSSSLPATSFLPPVEDSIRSPPELESHAEIEQEDDEQRNNEQSAYADQPAMRPIPQPGSMMEQQEIHADQSPPVGIPLSMLNPHKSLKQGSTKSSNPYVDEPSAPGMKLGGNEVVSNGNQPTPELVTVL